MANREGKKYKVINGDHDFDKGEILVLIRDDGDEIPCFRSKTTGHVALMKLDDLEEIKQPKGEVKMAKKIKGRQYKVIENGHMTFNEGDILELIIDDQTNSPLFKRLSDGVQKYVDMRRVELIKKPKHKVGKKYVVTGNGTGITHHFEKGEVVELTHIYDSGNKGEFRNKRGLGQTVSFKDVARLTKKVEVGKQAVVISRDKTDDRHGLVDSMAKVGEIIEVVKLTGAGERIVRGKKGSRTYSYAIEDVRGIKTKEKVEEEKPAKPKFEKGDIVRITANTNSSRNKVGDIGVIVEEVTGNNAVRVEVPNRKGSNGNWTKQDEMEPLGLKGEVK